MYEGINLTIPFPRVEQKHEIVAKYKVIAEFLALNPESTKSMLLSREEAKRCQNDHLGTCRTASLVYITGSNKLCMTGSFRGDKGWIEENCQYWLGPCYLKRFL